jgi:predicted nucleotidyltransferase
MSYVGTYKVVPPRFKYTAPSGATRHVRSYGRSQVFAISSGVQVNSPGYPSFINVKLHSCMTWKRPDLHTVNYAATELHLHRDDAERVIVAIQMAIQEYDKLVAPGAS